MAEHQSTVEPDDRVGIAPDTKRESRRVEQHRNARPKRQPPYAVILHNDDFNGMDFVVGVLRKVFNYGRIKSIRLMLQAHVKGSCVVWSGTRELAELKVEQVRSCGPDPAMRAHGAGTLRVTLEPLPD